MNKTFCMLAAACFSCLLLQAGENRPVTPVAAQPAQAEFEMNDGLLLTVGFGMMATNGNEHFSSGEEWIPSNLYGVQLNVSKEFAREGQHAHRLGVQSGYFYDTYKSSEWYALDSFDEGDEIYSFSTRVEVIPVLAAYDYVYELDEHFLIRGGCRAGVVIRTTSARGEAEQIYGASHFDTHSTKVKPVIGLGIGAEVRVSESSFMYIGFDFLQSFGVDCGPLTSTDGTAELSNAKTKDRFYGTISAGYTYVF